MAHKVYLTETARSLRSGEEIMHAAAHLFLCAGEATSGHVAVCSVHVFCTVWHLLVSLFSRLLFVLSYGLSVSL